MLRKFIAFSVLLALTPFLHAVSYYSTRSNGGVSEGSSATGTASNSILTTDGSGALDTDPDFTHNGTTVTFTGLTVTTGLIGTNRIGSVEGRSETANHLIQYSSAAVTADLTIDFTDAGLKDYAAAPYVVVAPVYDSNDDSVLGCTPHTISAAGFTIECSICSSD